MEKKIIKPKQINTVRNALGCKMVLNCDKAPGVPKAFLGFLFKKKKKKCSQSQTCLLFLCTVAPRLRLALGAGGFKAKQ